MPQEATNATTLSEAGRAIEGIANLLTQNAVRKDSEQPELLDGYTEGCLLAALNQLGKRVSEAGEG